MIAVCQVCGNHDWDKEVQGNVIYCPRCGNKWNFKKLPLFILTGCSGVGKTVTARKLQEETQELVVLDADMFYNIMPHETESDYYDQVEQMESLSKNINQCGRPVLWAMAGNIDKISRTYHYRFFETVYILALVCEEQSLQNRMMKGRGINDREWIQSSIDYNHFFKTHRQIGEMHFDVLDTEGKDVSRVAKEVGVWIKTKWKGLEI